MLRDVKIPVLETTFHKKHTPDNTLVGGVPAKSIKEIEDNANG